MSAQRREAAARCKATADQPDLEIGVIRPELHGHPDVDCSFEGARAREASALILHDEDLNAYNSFDNPDRIVPRKHPVSAQGSTVKLDLPRISVATITVRLA